jgi:hypothetical protein
VAKTACGQKLLVELHPNQHTTLKNNMLTVLPCLPGLYAAAAYIASTTMSTPTKLAGDFTHIPINIPIVAIYMMLVF